MNPLGITLFVVEKGEQSGERVGDGRWEVVVFKDLKHFKTLIKIGCTGILKKEPGVPTVLQSSPDLALPELAGEGVLRVRNKGGVGAGSGIAGATEPVQDEIARLKVVGGVLDCRKSEGRHGGKGDRARRGCHTKRWRGKGGSPSLRRTVDR